MGATSRRKPKAKVLVHYDQGLQFISMDWAAFLRHHSLEHSMSRRGNCHDNAVAESFFNLLKRERIRRKTYRTREEAKHDVLDYIEMFYNPKRKPSETECCRLSSSNGSAICSQKASTKLGAIQTINFPASPSASDL